MDDAAPQGRWVWQAVGSGAARAAVALGEVPPPQHRRQWQGQVLVGPDSENVLLALDAGGLHAWRRTQLRGGAAHWRRDGPWPFPLEQALVAGTLLPALGLVGTAEDRIAGHEDLVQRVCRPGVRVFHVRLRQALAMLGDGVARMNSLVEVHGASLAHVALSHRELAPLVACLARHGLDGRDDEPLLLALRRLAGWAPPAAADRVDLPAGTG